MKIKNAILLVIALVGVAAAQKPPVLEDTYWGPGEKPKQQDETVRPFKIQFDKGMIDDLKYRLKNTRTLAAPLKNVNWTYGIPSDSVSTVVDYWLNKYDFGSRQTFLNQYPQYLTNIQGLDIHFIHVKPQVPKNSSIEVLPLYLQHGWPGSIVEFYKVIPMLTTPRKGQNFVFEVVIPSIPGFGYSGTTGKAGLGAVEIAHVMKNLMLRLGFEKWYTQGGDWGSIITSYMAAIYPQHVLGMHSNWCFVLKPTTWLKILVASKLPFLLPKEERDLMLPMTETLKKLLLEMGFFYEQATKPETVGVGLTDSPAGLAAWILEKFSSLTNENYKFSRDGKLTEKFTMDELLDDVMLYWAPNKITSSFRIYAETFSAHGLKYKMDSVPIKVPSACAQFPHEVLHQAPKFLRDRYVNLVHTKNMPRGGHFAAMEEPQLLADDVWEAVQIMRKRTK